MQPSLTDQEWSGARPANPTSDDLSLRDVVTPLLLEWRLITLCVGVGWLVSLMVIFVPDRRYDASMVLATVPSGQGVTLPGGISGLLAGAQTGGIQPTPSFVTRVMHLRSVLSGVALSQSSSDPGRVVIERVLERPVDEIRPGEIEREMKGLLDAEVDKQTGLITLHVTHSDSALAREIALKTVEFTSNTFVRAVRAQATEQRIALDARVDSAAKSLRASEGRLLSFVSTNREYTAYSAAAVERQRIERELNNAQTVYSQAITDREQAVARELEATPAVVVVDSIPSELAPVPRQAILKLFVGVLLGFILAVLAVFLKIQLASRSARHAGAGYGERSGSSAIARSGFTAPPRAEHSSGKSPGAMPE